MAQTIINISSPNDGLGDPLRSAMNKVNNMFTELYTNVVFKEVGKGLSTNDYTTTEQTKLAGIATGAEVNVQGDMLQSDNTQDDFIKNKDAFNIDIFKQTFTYISGAQTFTLSAGMKAQMVFLNRALLDDLTEWSQTSNVITVTYGLTANDEIKIIGIKQL